MSIPAGCWSRDRRFRYGTCSARFFQLTFPVPRHERYGKIGPAGHAQYRDGAGVDDIQTVDITRGVLDGNDLEFGLVWEVMTKV